MKINIELPYEEIEKTIKKEVERYTDYYVKEHIKYKYREEVDKKISDTIEQTNMERYIIEAIKELMGRYQIKDLDRYLREIGFLKN